jgi:hypothetical protein
MIRSFVFLLLLLGEIHGRAQRNCVVQFSYTGNVHLKSWKVGSILLPSTSYLTGQTKKDDPRSVVAANITDGYFKIDAGSHENAVFCAQLDSIIKHVFKGEHKTYSVTIVEQKTDHVGEYRQVTVEIPVEKIQFIAIAEPPRIVINLPELH